jgi:hypothetical protein
VGAGCSRVVAFEFFAIKVPVTSEEIRKQPNPPAGQHEDQRGVAISSMVRFQLPVLRAEAVLQGYFFKYDDGDHAFGTERVAIRNVKVFGGVAVTFDVVVLMQDGDYLHLPLDDTFHGSVDVLVLAELEDGLPHSSIRWRTASVDFPLSPKVGRTLGGSVSFGRPVKWAHAMLKGLRTEYDFDDDDDSFLQEAGVHVSKIQGDVVDFEATFSLANWYLYVGKESQAAAERQGQDARAHLDVVILAEL